MTTDIPDHGGIDDHAFMLRALEFVRISRDPLAQVGCIAVDRDNSVIAMAVNGIPKQLCTAMVPRSGPSFYAWVEHAERRLIYGALSEGHSLAGSTLYVTWFPCIDCARAIVQVGVTTLVTSPPDYHDAIWGKSMQWAETLLSVAGVTLRQVEVSP